MSDADHNDSPAPTPRPDIARRRRAALKLRRAQVIYLCALIGFAALAVLAHLDAYFAWDLAVARALQSQHEPGFSGLMRAVSILGNTWKPFALTTAAFIVFLFFKQRSEAAGLLFSAGGSSLVNSLVKLTVARPRPSSALVQVLRPLHTNSFPSGHVTFYVCYFGFLFFVALALLPHRAWLRRLALVATSIPVALIGLSRVYLGEHWPSDALGAYLVGGLWLALSLHLYRVWKERSTFHPA